MQVPGLAHLLAKVASKVVSELSAMNRLVRPLCAVFAVVWLAGCSQSPERAGSSASTADARMVELRRKYVLAEEPSGAIAIADAKKGLEGQPEVVLAGRIGAGKHDPWEKGKATFIISDAITDPTGHANSPGHDAENCPFCKRRASSADSTAIVQFVDEAGQVLPVDARALLEAEKDQVVIVKGRGEVNALGTLVVSAQGIYLKP